MEVSCRKCIVQSANTNGLCDECTRRGDDYVVACDPHNMLLIYYNKKTLPNRPDYTDIKLCVNCKKSRDSGSGFCEKCPTYTLCSKCRICKPNPGKAWCDRCWKEQQTAHLPNCSCCQKNKSTPGYKWCKQCYDDPPPHMIDLSLPHNWPEKAIRHVIEVKDDNKKQKSSSTVRLFFTSDTHNEHKEIYKRLIKPDLLKKDGENILIHTGDWSQMGDKEQTEAFCAWLEEIQKEGIFKHIVIVCGNHERTCGAKLNHEELKKELEKIRSVIYLAFDMVVFKEYGNLTILGISWWEPCDIIPIFNDFKTLPTNIFSIDSKYEQSKVAHESINHINIMISHHPPLGILDEWRGNSKGSKRIEDFIRFLTSKDLAPRLHVFGHVHKLGKKEKEIKDVKGKTIFYNIAQSVGYYDFYYTKPK